MTEGDLTAKSCTVGIVGVDTKFTILSDEDLEPYVAAMKEAEDAPAGMPLISEWLSVSGDCFNLH